MGAIYDKIGIGYSHQRKPDRRIARAIHDALGDARSVLNVGAGTGSYEPTDRVVTALEPSAEMISQRPSGSATAYQGTAEDMPFADDQFDAAMAVLTVHHWSDLEAGLREMRRVTKGRLVILTFDPASPYFWLADYIPEIVRFHAIVQTASWVLIGNARMPISIRAFAQQFRPFRSLIMCRTPWQGWNRIWSPVSGKSVMVI